MTTSMEGRTRIIILGYRSSGPLGALLSSPALDVRLMTALQVLQDLGGRAPPARPADTPSRAGSARGRLPRGRRGYFARWRPTSQASSRGFGYRGYQERYITPFQLSPQRLSLLPYLGISCAGAAPCVVHGSDREAGIFFILGDGDGSAPALLVLRSTFSFLKREGNLLRSSRLSGGVEV